MKSIGLRHRAWRIFAKRRVRGKAQKQTNKSQTIIDRWIENFQFERTPKTVRAQGISQTNAECQQTLLNSESSAPIERRIGLRNIDLAVASQSHWRSVTYLSSKEVVFRFQNFNYLKGPSLEQTLGNSGSFATKVL